ncbi:uncharacterized protein LOC127576912 [Pristis pectinata]|uniref:uncharacterized protein LOC127576912 n=1 Tax=Pristis pectinata TaxID=685728 RepID=UPI00223DDB95|nr:uncharacterized protein LOC127576912 [Pristis pectinata]
MYRRSAKVMCEAHLTQLHQAFTGPQDTVPADTTVGDLRMDVPVITTVVTMATVVLTSVTTVLTWIMDTVVVTHRQYLRLTQWRQQATVPADTTVGDLHLVVPVITTVITMAPVALISVTTVPTLITDTVMTQVDQTQLHQAFTGPQDTVPADTTVGDLRMDVPVITTVVTMATVVLTSVTTVLTWIMDTVVVTHRQYLRLTQWRQQATVPADTTVGDLHLVVPVITTVITMAPVALISVTTVPTLITDTVMTQVDQTQLHQAFTGPQDTVPADTTVGDLRMDVPVITTVVTMATVVLTSVTTVLTWIMDTVVVTHRQYLRLTQWRQQATVPADTTVGDLHLVVPVITTVITMAPVALISVTTVPTLITDTVMTQVDQVSNF